MPNVFKFKHPNAKQDNELKLTDLAKEIFADGAPGQGFVGIVDLLTGEIHLSPVYEDEDDKKKMSTFSQQYAVMQSARTGLGLTTHERAISQLRLVTNVRDAVVAGQFLGFGCRKGKGDSLLESFANRSASINLTSIEYDPTYLALNPDRDIVERSIPDTVTKKITDVLCQELVANPTQKRDVKRNNNTPVKYSTEVFEALSPEDLAKLMSVDDTVNLHDKLFKDPDEFIKLLQDAGEKINAVNLAGRTLLMRAAISNRPDLIEILLKHGASLNIPDAQGVTVLSWAVENGHYLIAKKLYAGHAPTDPLTRILISVANGNPIKSAEVETLAENPSDYQQKTMDLILFFAIKNADTPAVIEDLVKKGASICALNRHNKTALIAAIENENFAVVEKLLKFDASGASLDIADLDNNTALIAAVKKDDLRVVEKLLELGASVNAKNRDGRTALMYAAAYGSQEMVTKLLEKGALANIKDKYDCTVLSIASKDNKPLIQEKLAQQAKQTENEPPSPT